MKQIKDLTPEQREEWIKSLNEGMEMLAKEIEERKERQKTDPPNRIRHDIDLFFHPKVEEYWIDSVKEPAAKIETGWYSGFSEEEVKKTMECEDNPQVDDRQVMIIKHDMIPELIEKLQKIYEIGKNIK